MSKNGEAAILRAIDEAEEILDPLDGLVGKSENDAGAPFAPEVLKRLKELRRDDRAAFEVLRSELKRAGTRITALDEAMGGSGSDSDHDPSQADTLLDLAKDIGRFHSPDSTAYADIEVNGHRETWRIRSIGFRRWLARKYYEKTEGAPNQESINSALNVIEAEAFFDGPEMDVHVRVAGQDGKIYIDLVDDEWRAVEIDPEGWRIVTEPPVRFRRSAGMQSLPEPTRGGTVEMLRPFLNLKNPSEFVLVICWILGGLRDKGPYLIIVISGEQGSGKSNFCAILRKLLDPNSSPLRALSREDRDLFITATNGHLLTFDNVSKLSPWISDTLCRIATGGGFAVRQLYADQDEVLFEVTRPIILNSIEDIVTRPDLADRAIFLTLEQIPEESRKSEETLWAEFEKVRPKILGALLDAVSTGLKRIPEIKLDAHPRMADFARWAIACETAIWPEGTFWAAYTGNQAQAVDNVIEASLVASAIRSMMSTCTEWIGTATELLKALGDLAGQEVTKTKSWPKAPTALSGHVRRAADSLRKIGIDIKFEREGRGRTRNIHISSGSENSETEPSAPSASSAFTGIPPQINFADGADDADANNPLLPGELRPRT
jgi:hypothetical protein